MQSFIYFTFVLKGYLDSESETDHFQQRQVSILGKMGMEAKEKNKRPSSETRMIAGRENRNSVREMYLKV